MAVLWGGASPPAQAAQRFRYAALPLYSTAAQPAEVPGRTTAAPGGWLRVTPLRSQLTITVDDVVAMRSMHVALVQGEAVRRVCVHDRVPLTVRGLVVGEPVTILIHDRSYRDRCMGGATTGVLLIAR